MNHRNTTPGTATCDAAFAPFVTTVTIMSTKRLAKEVHARLATHLHTESRLSTLTRLLNEMAPLQSGQLDHDELALAVHDEMLAQLHAAYPEVTVFPSNADYAAPLKKILRQHYGKKVAVRGIDIIQRNRVVTPGNAAAPCVKPQPMNRKALWDAMEKANADATASPTRNIVLATGQHALAFLTSPSGDDLVLNIAVSGGYQDDAGQLVTFSTVGNIAAWDVSCSDPDANIAVMADWMQNTCFPVILANT